MDLCHIHVGHESRLKNIEYLQRRDDAVFASGLPIGVADGEIIGTAAQPLQSAYIKALRVRPR